MSTALISIVEGHGEVKAIPVLISRVLQLMGVVGIHAGPALRKHRHEIVMPDKLEKALLQACKLRSNVGGILVVLDADDDCPAQLGPNLLERAVNTTHLPVRVIIVQREMEAWFLACKESFRGFMGIPDHTLSLDNAEEVDAKGRLLRNMHGVKYRSSLHQVEFARRMDLGHCRMRSRSFDKFMRDIEFLVSAVGRD
jgi:hypothetical protein